MRIKEKQRIIEESVALLSRWVSCSEAGGSRGAVWLWSGGQPGAASMGGHDSVEAPSTHTAQWKFPGLTGT